MISSLKRFATVKGPRLAAMAVSCAVLLTNTAISAEPVSATDFQEFAVSRLNKPLAMDCATKHAKYLQADAELATISGGDSHRNQARSRQSYNKTRARYAAPEVMLSNAEHEMLELSSLLDTDQPVMLNFIFTTCTTICPVLSASFKQVQDLLGDDAAGVLMISVTIDPEYDTPEKLAGYAQRFEAGPQWQFLTGQLSDVIEVEKAFDIYRGSKTNHEPITLIRVGRSREWLRIEGFANAAEIVAEYRQLLNQDTPEPGLDRLSQNTDSGVSAAPGSLVQ